MPSHIFRWNLSRQYDQHVVAGAGGSAPANLLVFQYLHDGGAAYIQDIYDTPPASGDVTTLGTYAHHTRLDYQSRPDATSSYRRTFRTDYGLRLSTVTVTSMPFTAGTSRELVRRYTLAYDPNYHVSLLQSVTLEGRCTAGPTPENGSGDISPDPGCPTLPPMTFSYSHVSGYQLDGTPVTTSDLVGYEPIDERLHAMVGSPDHSVDEDVTDLFDVNADGLPDVLVTSPGLYGNNYGVFYNGIGGTTGTFLPSVMGVCGEGAGAVTLDNDNVQVGDLDSDGIVNLVHVPMVNNYWLYTPLPRVAKAGCFVASATGALPSLPTGLTEYDWSSRQVTTAASLSPKIDFGTDGDRIRLADVNGDGLVDVVRTTGTQIESYLALGRYPGGDGQFGHATWTSPTTATLSNQPIVSCLPYAGTAVAFDDPLTRLADMNGDGLVDIVRLYNGSTSYWPGNGDGHWGTGEGSGCSVGGFESSTAIVLANSPFFADPNASGVRLDDVNGDGLDDLVQTGFSTVSIWLNVDGTGFTPNRHVINGTPAEPSFQNRIRLADMNGSGTRDILWGDGLNYQYIDLTGGTQPWLLTGVANGLGKTSQIDYATSVELLQASRAAGGTPWTSWTPNPMHVVVRETERDHLGMAGRPDGVYVTEYQYKNPVYDGVQKEFRGFSWGAATRIGDANSPTSTTASTFLLGQCGSEEVSDSPDPCSFPGRWRDNPREALKGLPVRSDTYDAAGNYEHTVHHQYHLRTLTTGLDGRRVVHAFEEQSDDFLFDDAPFVAATTPSAALVDVNVESTLGGTLLPLAIPSAPTAGNPLTKGAQPFSLPTDAAHAAQVTHQSTVDSYGNALSSIDFGCVSCGDTQIKSFTDPGYVPGDTTGWQWRTLHFYTLGDDGISKRHETYNQYNSGMGDLIGTQATLSGSLPLARSNTGGAVLAAPSTSSSGGRIQTSTIEVDVYGQTIFTSTPGGHCHEIAYDPAYEQLAISETVLVGIASSAPPAPGSDPAKAMCGTTPLTAQVAKYDRGLQLITDTTDIHGEPTRVAYDGFGRVLSLKRPSAKPTGTLSAAPSVTIDYQLTSDPLGQPYSIVHTTTADGADEGDGSVRHAYAYADGMGRQIVTLEQADLAAGDAAPWVAKGLTEYDAKGAAKRAYRAWWYSGDPEAFPLNSASPAKYGEQQYDAFGRVVVSYNLDGQASMVHKYHALSVDAWDAEDLGPGPHEGTYATAAKDGHGREAASVERATTSAGTLEEHWTHRVFLTTGEVSAIVRNQSSNPRDASSPRVVRFSAYDSLGRVVMNVDPSASKNVPWSATGDPLGVLTAPATYGAWRYAYDDAGELVGTSDPRGCGVNFAYDAGGRLVSETYSPCSIDHLPNTSGRADVEYTYDDDTGVSLGAAGDAVWSCDSTLLLGRLVAVRDRASHIRTCYDGRGRVTQVQKQLARGDVAYATSEGDYSAEAPILATSYDAADRPVVETSPSVDPAGVKTTTVEITYSKRGSVVNLASAEYGPLVSSVFHDADGQLTQVVYADAAKTQTDLHYDDRLRLQHVLTSRGPPAIWSGVAGYSPAPTPSGTPTSFQLVLQDAVLAYDSVDNPIEIRDNRIDAEWPAGAKPAHRTIEYDDLYRVTNVAYERATVGETYQDPYRDGTSSARAEQVRPRQSVGTRVTSEGFAFDWLGNTVASDDDQHAFLDRSLGTVANGGGMASPYQLTAAGQNVPGSPLNGALWASYDAAGGLTDWAVARDCGAGGGSCSVQYHYVWDEVGRLASAERWDLPRSAVSATPTGERGTTPTYAEGYLYDSGDARVVTHANGSTGPTTDLYYYASFEERKVTLDSAGEYICPVGGCARAYLMAHDVRVAHLDIEPSAGLPTTGADDARIHVMLEVADYLGSTNLVVDRDTSELVECATYSAMGDTEGEYRSARWDGWREDYGFTGKEESRSLGITYFGARWLVPELGRWASADPLAVHGGGADLNAYAYVKGQSLRASDPVGLAPEPASSARPKTVATPPKPVISTPPPAAGAGPAPTGLQPTTPTPYSVKQMYAIFSQLPGVDDKMARLLVAGTISEGNGKLAKDPTMYSCYNGNCFGIELPDPTKPEASPTGLYYKPGGVSTYVSVAAAEADRTRYKDWSWGPSSKSSIAGQVAQLQTKVDSGELTEAKMKSTSIAVWDSSGSFPRTAFPDIQSGGLSYVFEVNRRIDILARSSDVHHQDLASKVRAGDATAFGEVMTMTIVGGSLKDKDTGTPISGGFGAFNPGKKEDYQKSVGTQLGEVNAGLETK
ncbi:MAG: toxin TcdB middle/N-terminal domain-containing protein [Polyangiales bacterium]